MEGLKRENENNKQLYKSLLKDYEDALYQLAEARLHIDRLRFGAEVDINKHFIITHSRMDYPSSSGDEHEENGGPALIMQIQDLQSRLSGLHDSTACSGSYSLDGVKSELLDIHQMHQRLSNELAPLLIKDDEKAKLIKKELMTLAQQLKDFINLLQDREQKIIQNSMRRGNGSSYVPPITSQQVFPHTSSCSDDDLNGVSPAFMLPRTNAWSSNEYTSSSDTGLETAMPNKYRKHKAGLQLHTQAGKTINNMRKNKSSLIPRPKKPIPSFNKEAMQSKNTQFLLPPTHPVRSVSKIPTFRGRTFNKETKGDNRRGDPIKRQSRIPRRVHNGRNQQNGNAFNQEGNNEKGNVTERPQSTVIKKSGLPVRIKKTASPHQIKNKCTQPRGELQTFARPNLNPKSTGPSQNEDHAADTCTQDMIQGLKNDISTLMKELGHIKIAEEKAAGTDCNGMEGDTPASNQTSSNKGMENGKAARMPGSDHKRNESGLMRSQADTDVNMNDKSATASADKSTQVPSVIIVPKERKRRNKKKRHETDRYTKSSSSSLSSYDSSVALRRETRPWKKKKKPAKRWILMQAKKKRNNYIVKHFHDDSSSSSSISSSLNSKASSIVGPECISIKRRRRPKKHLTYTFSNPQSHIPMCNSLHHSQVLHPILHHRRCVLTPEPIPTRLNCSCPHSESPDLIPRRSQTQTFKLQHCKSLDLSEAINLAEDIKSSSKKINKTLLQRLATSNS